MLMLKQCALYVNILFDCVSFTTQETFCQLSLYSCTVTVSVVLVCMNGILMVN